MKPQTRQLVRLLADDVTGRLIEALRVQSQTTPQLEKLAGSSQKTVAQALELLLAHGVVEWAAPQLKTPGRPSRVWRLAAVDELAVFERACDEFKASMLRRQLDEHENE